MPPKTDASAVNSSTANTEAIPSGEGKIPQKSSEQLASEYKAEAERKQVVIESLNGKLESMENRLSDLTSLIESGQATAAQQREAQTLARGNATLEQQISELEARPDVQPWLASTDRRIEKKLAEAESRGAQAALAELQKDYLLDQAEANSMKYDDFIKAIKPFAAKYENENLVRKAKMATRDWKDFEKYKKDKAEFEKTKASYDSSQESVGRMTRETPIEESIAKKDFISQAKTLGL